MDLGGVLVDVDLEAIPRRLDRPRSELEAAFFYERRHEALNRGAVDPGDYFGEVAARLELPCEEVEAAWCAVVSWKPYAGALLEAAAGSGAVLHIWSNTDPRHFAVLQRGLPQLELASHLALSYALRCAKPDPAFYEAALAQSGAAPAQVVFVDDRADNVASARALGIDARQAEGEQAVRAALGDLLSFGPG